MNKVINAELRQVSETALETILKEDFGIHITPGAIRDFDLDGTEIYPELYEMAHDYASEVHSEIAEHIATGQARFDQYHEEDSFNEASSM